MAWINYTSGNISAFEEANPEAVVVVHEDDVARTALDFDDGTCRIKVTVIEHQKITEYRALTKETAEHLKAELTCIDKKRLLLSYSDSTYGQHHANCPDLIGTERLCAISRSNEAGCHRLTVTESTTDWDAEVPGEYVQYGMTGAGSDVKGDVRISWGHSA